MRLLVIATLAACLLAGGCGRRYVDKIDMKLAPDGSVVAASDINSGEFVFAAQVKEVRVYPPKGKLRNGEVILAYGEDDGIPQVAWASSRSLQVHLPCGWWSNLTNHYQIPETSTIIDITYLPPLANCPPSMTSSAGLPGAS